MTEDGIAEFPTSPDLSPLTVPEVLASLLLVTMTARAGCTAASVDGVNDFVSKAVWVGMDSLHARGLVVPYRHPGVLVTESVAWDIGAIEMLAERSLADMLGRGLLKELGRETDGRP